jgi:SAM-dependent methyltransferase
LLNLPVYDIPVGFFSFVMFGPDAMIRATIILLYLFAGGGVIAQSDPWKDIYSESAWKERDTWQKPAELIRRLKLTPGSNVADIGCHQGYLSFRLAPVVGPGGKVYAVDVDQSKLDKVKAYAEKNSIKNVITVKGDYDDPHLPAGILAGVIILDTYHEMDDHDKILQHVKVALKPGGRLVICEPVAESRREAARDTQEGKHELAMNFAVEDLKRAGFVVVEQTDRFIDREKVKGDKMWVIVAEKR